MTNTSNRPKVITINPSTGCDRHSPGCKNCYALRIIPRLQGFGNKKYSNGAAITFCKIAKVPFWIKQMGSYGGRAKKGGNLLDGRVCEEWPDLDNTKKHQH